MLCVARVNDDSLVTGYVCDVPGWGIQIRDNPEYAKFFGTREDAKEWFSGDVRRIFPEHHFFAYCSFKINQVTVF